MLKNHVEMAFKVFMRRKFYGFAENRWYTHGRNLTWPAGSVYAGTAWCGADGHIYPRKCDHILFERSGN